MLGQSVWYKIEPMCLKVKAGKCYCLSDISVFTTGLKMSENFKWNGRIRDKKYAKIKKIALL
jgi:hypothetical protein